MGSDRSRSLASLPASARKLVEEGKAIAPRRDMREVLATVGPPPGPVTDAGTRALREDATIVPERVGVLYADTSALVKLAVNEAETDALRDELQQRHDVATSVVTEIELARAVARVRASGALALDEIGVMAITWAALEIELTPEICRQF